ncbi:MAG: hypothetical protein WCY15_12920 [Phenylobacterium sp.]|jgi:hypothetical protein|uniref:hypothetical protein n=1 Tax=Phenylobacterium sp. TaxID=1871053 RepID=UPI002A331E9D|nr:hypothetical protein [Phenylobacterium sp.]MDD3838448.1 hypothetical protein [Phenylobacterium sp.]MDX9998611.1 hypothetical protein [Phenylobacterium sp.]
MQLNPEALARMDGRKERIAREAAALWREVFGQTPDPAADGSDLLDALMQRLEPKHYERLNRPHLRDAELVFPRRR